MKSPATESTFPAPAAGGFMKWVRRAHLFLGLFMAPWILTFGATGFYFHHQAWFVSLPKAPPAPPTVQIELPAAAWTSTALARWPEADEWARKVMAVLNRPGEPGYVLTAGSSRWEGQVFLPITWEAGTSGGGTINPVTQTGRIFRMPTPAPPTPDLSMEPVELQMDPMLDETAKENLRAELAPMIRQADPTVREVNAPRLPGLLFRAEQGGRSFRVHLDPNTGEIRAQPMPPLSPLSFLGRLHKDSGKYAAGPWVRVAWALLADLVAVSICFWTLTGLIMWLQLKPLHRTGAFLLLATLILLGLVLAGMWGIFSNQ